MSNWTSTRKANLVVSLILDNGNWSGRTTDPHPPVGNEAGTTRLARVELRFSEPSWPSSGHLVSASLTLNESGTSSHGGYKGGNSRAWVRRINETPDRDHPSNTAGVTKEFTFNGSETHDVAEMVELMLPTKIKRRDGTTPGGNTLYGWLAVRSSDEADYHRSFIMTDDAYLTVEIKDVATPDAPDVSSPGLGPVGAQLGANGDPDPSNPTIVASTDGQTLAVKYRPRHAAGDTPSKVELELWDPLDDDALLEAGTGHRVRTTGAITPSADEGGGVRTIRLTGLPLGTDARYTVRTTSTKGGQGDRSSIDDDASHVKLVVLPGPPLDIVFQPFALDPHVLFTLNSPDSADYLTGGEVEATFVPQLSEAYFSGMKDLGGFGIRRADIDTGLDMTPGQRVSFRVRTRNKDQVVGQWSAPQVQTVQEAQAVTFSPSPGRLPSLTPTITLSFPLADGARLVLRDPVDDTKVVYDSGATVLVNQTSHAFVIPAGKLAYGQSYRAYGSYVPDGGGVIYTAESTPITYTIAGLAVTALSVPDAVSRHVGVQDIVWLRTVTDPGGAAIASIEQEIRVAATPQGTGALVVDHVDTTATALRTIPGGTVVFEQAVDSRARAKNDTGVFGSWSSWLTITTLQPPDVDLLTPLDAVTIADPTATLDWSVTGYGGRAQATAVATIYALDGAVLASLATTTATGVDILAYLLADAMGYAWDVTVTDDMGMVTTSARQTFATAFAEPLPISVLLAEADPGSRTVVLTFDDPLEPYPHNIEVVWIGDLGNPVRIDGGPESLLDGRPPFTGATLIHLGARDGLNVYYVAVSNGWRSSEPVSAQVTLTPDDPAFPWAAVADGPEVVQLAATISAMPHAATIERFQPPGGQPRQITHGLEARRWTLTVESLSASDPEIVPTFRDWMGDGTGFWLKAPAGVRLDPVWVALQSMTPSPGSFGIMPIDLDMAELGDPVHAILTPAVEPPPTGEGDIWVSTDQDDFGTFTIAGP